VGSGASALVFEPGKRSTPSSALIWIFGGGLVTGSADHVTDVASHYAHELGAVVIAPDYRLAPEHPYPAAIDDCFSALTWTIASARELGIDPARIAVGGESAGGGLAAALAQRAADEGIDLRLQLLIAPMLDDRTVRRAEAEGRVTVAWTVPSNRFGWSSYLGHDLDRDEQRPYAVPARRDDLRRLAPAWISVGEVDLFHDEDADYASRLREAGVPVELHTIPGAHHAFEVMKPDHPTVRLLKQARIDALRAALTPRS
jgi:acetyl esterase/lipase